MEGQRLVFLFPPEDTENIYELVGGLDEHRSDGSFGYATHISEVNLFFPSSKRHPLFSKCNALVSLLGEGKTLVIPSGWWWTAISTQPSVTLHHTYWSFENRLGFVDALWAPFESQQTSVDVRNAMRPAFTELRELILRDDGPTTLRRDSWGRMARASPFDPGSQACCAPGYTRPMPCISIWIWRRSVDTRPSKDKRVRTARPRSQQRTAFACRSSCGRMGWRETSTMRDSTSTPS
eukprot:g22661.t1